MYPHPSSPGAGAETSHDLILLPQPSAPPEVARSPLMQPEHAVHPPLLQHREIEIRTIITIAQDHVLRLQLVPEAAKQGVLPRLLPGVLADGHLQAEPVARQKSTTNRAIGKPKPGF